MALNTHQDMWYCSLPLVGFDEGTAYAIAGKLITIQSEKVKERRKLFHSQCEREPEEDWLHKE